MEASDDVRSSSASATKNNPTSPISSEESDSWTLLGNNKDQLEQESSGVEIITSEIEGDGDLPVEDDHVNHLKQRRDSFQCNLSQLDESSDGISVISESDVTSGEPLMVSEECNEENLGSELRFRQVINLKLPNCEPLTPPYTPDEQKVQEETVDTQLELQSTAGKLTELKQSLVEHHHAPVKSSTWVIFGVVATAMVAIILGNGMRLKSRVDDINFEHEKRISELELENNILKNEMNKLRHLYTRSELDEQVQRAEFEWAEILRQSESASTNADNGAIPEEIDKPIVPEQQTVRKVPPQDAGVKRKVVWSGDEEEPMLIVDKDYILPSFCYNQDNAIRDDLFSEYSAKYCDVKKRKIEAKQRKTEFNQGHQKKVENYEKFIQPRQQSTKSTADGATNPGKLASPFNIDYKKAIEAIKSEGSVIVEALGSILDLSPEPEELIKSDVVDCASASIDTTVSSPADPDLTHHKQEQHYEEPTKSFPSKAKCTDGGNNIKRNAWEPNEDFIRVHDEDHKRMVKGHQQRLDLNGEGSRKVKKESPYNHNSEKPDHQKEWRKHNQHHRSYETEKKSHKRENEHKDRHHEKKFNNYQKEHVDGDAGDLHSTGNGGGMDFNSKKQFEIHETIYDHQNYNENDFNHASHSEGRHKQHGDRKILGKQHDGDRHKHTKSHYEQKHHEKYEKHHTDAEHYRQNHKHKKDEWHKHSYKERDQSRWSEPKDGGKDKKRFKEYSHDD